MSLRDDLLNRVVRPELRSSVMLPTTGSVRTIYPDAMRADVFIEAPWTGDTVLLKRIPVLVTPGVAAPLPSPGDTVSVVFQGSSLQTAVIVANMNEYYHVSGRERTRHEQKGAYLPDAL